MTINIDADPDWAVWGLNKIRIYAPISKKISSLVLPERNFDNVLSYKRQIRSSVWFHHILFEKSLPRKWYNEILPGLLLLMFTLKELGFVINFPAIWLRLCFFYWSTRYHISRSVLTLSWWPREWAIKIQNSTDLLSLCYSLFPSCYCRTIQKARVIKTQVLLPSDIPPCIL